MREVITQVAIAFILWALAVEVAGWAKQRWFGDRWWVRLIGERTSLQEVPEPVKAEA